jgi:hypothetical protein
MQDKTWTLKDALFGVELADVFVKAPPTDLLFDTGERKLVPADRFKAVMAQDNGYVFAVVTSDYDLVTNEQAKTLGEVCFQHVFSVTNVKDMIPFNMIMPKHRSFCHMDFVHKGAKEVAPFKGDAWTPYLRVTNSYNRMFALNFDLGFCRGICKNGVIFGKKNIVFKFVHSKHGRSPEVAFKLRAGELSTLEVAFAEALVNLKRFHVPRKVMWALACKIFKQSIPASPSPRQQQTWAEKQNAIASLTDNYFKALGENGYAALNVLTDFASRPAGMISVEQRIDHLQRLSGDWMADFINAIESREFSFERYLGEYHALVA